jgi:hypothetical protein
MTENTKKKPQEKQQTEEAASQVHWDTSNLKISYVNVCNATTTREEVVLNFGMNEGWERTQKEVDIQLTHRIILSPFAAKRLVDLLNKLMGDYEARYGELKM